MEDFQARCGEVRSGVFEMVQRYGGSISAEHGVGLLKKDRTCATAAPTPEIALMAGIKRVFDPAGILNPGKFADDG